MTAQTLIRAQVKRICNNYLIIKELGRGSSGVVYLAHDTKMHRYVAIKELTLDSELSEEYREELIYNFKKEATTIANLHHENIVNVYDIVQEGSNYFIIMEFIEGMPLSKILMLHEIPLEMSLNIIIQICDALGYIHRNGVIHRDVKPENIILLGKGQAKLLDFGLAKLSNFESAKFPVENGYESNSGGLMGTILYMSPEQLQNSDNVDERADIYSLAVSLYEMLTGYLPFTGESTGDAVMKILEGTPLPPSKMNPGIPKSLDNIILKAMSKNKNVRYSSVSHFASELRNFLEYKTYLEMTEMELSH
jgi:serine/threonine protein kinase